MIVKHHLGENALEIKFCGLMVRRIPYENIDSVRLGFSFWTEQWCDVWPMFRYITIRRKKPWLGIMRNLMINPPDRERFLADLQKRLR